MRVDNNGWRLSPVYDVNPNPDNTGMLSTAISEGVYETNLENVLNVAEYFGLTLDKANNIIITIKSAVSQWKQVATKIGLSSTEIHKMQIAFKG